MSSLRTIRLHNLRRFRALSGAERRRLIRAALRLLAIDLHLRLRGFAAVAAAVERRGVRPAAGGEGSVDLWVRAVDVAARHHLYSMSCLPRALALRSLLAEEGVATDLRIGVRKEGAALTAHAWVEQEGVPVGEIPAIAERFAPLARTKVAEGAKAARGAFC